MYESQTSRGDGSQVDPMADGGPALGDVVPVPVPPGAVDRVRLTTVLADMDDDPWFDEDWYQPTPEEEEDIFLLDHPELARPAARETIGADPGATDDHTDPYPAEPHPAEPATANAAEPVAGGLSAETAGTEDADADPPDGHGWVPDQADDAAEAVRWHPDVQVPARLPDLENEPGGAELAVVVAAATLSELGAYELVEHVAACERVASAMQALQARSIAELMRRQQMRPLVGARASVDPPRVTALEVAARLAKSARDGDALVARADYLTRVLPDTFAAWATGVIDTDKADLIGRRLCRLDPALARRVEAQVLGEAPTVTVDTLRRLIAKAIQRLDPKDAEERHRRAHRDRFVRITPTDDGMAWIEAYVSAADAAAVKAVLDAGAEDLKQRDHKARRTRERAGTDGDGRGRAGTNPGGRSTGAAADTAANDGELGADRSMANRRADVLTSLAWAALAAGRIGGCGGCRAGLNLQDAHQRPVTVNLTLPASSLLGLTDEPAELEGYGPIPAVTARELSRNAVWRRLLTDPASGTVLDVGRTRYRPPADLAEHILLRDGTCVWPGCDRPAIGPGIDIDHIRAWFDGGPTADYNLGPFCDRHHTDKHETAWQVSQTRPGRFEFISPTGHRYIREPTQIGPVTQPLTDPDPPSDPNPPGAPDPPKDADPPPF